MFTFHATLSSSLLLRVCHLLQTAILCHWPTVYFISFGSLLSFFSVATIDFAIVFFVCASHFVIISLMFLFNFFFHRIQYIFMILFLSILNFNGIIQPNNLIGNKMLQSICLFLRKML